MTPPIDNLIFEQDGATASLDDLITGTERGLLVTCLWYIREVDPQTLLLTGLTRDGVYLVEGGEVVGAVNNFRFNESPVDLLSRITEVGKTVRCLPREWNDYFSRTAMPPVKVTDFNMSTVSQASSGRESAAQTSSSRNPTFIVTWKCSTSPSTMCPLISVTSNQSRCLKVCDARWTPLRTACWTLSPEVPTISVTP